MAFVRYSQNGKPTIGFVKDDQVFATSHSTLHEALMDSGAAAPSGSGQPLDKVDLLPAVDPTAKILCVALNYVDHAKEANSSIPETPILFFKSQEAMIAAGDPIKVPKAVTELDWEGELAIIIGKDAYEISKADAWDHIGGIESVLKKVNESVKVYLPNEPENSLKQKFNGVKIVVNTEFNQIMDNIWITDVFQNGINGIKEQAVIIEKNNKFI